MSDAPGPLLASGRDADVYDLGDGRVLRRYRDHEHDTEFEARVMHYVRERDYPVPTVYQVGGTDMIMDRIDGVTMLESVRQASWKVALHARTLASLQRRLAKIRAPQWLLAPTADPDHAESVLHLDLHPMNVMLSKRHGPMVIDWANAAGGPAGFDAALTYVTISTFPVDSARDTIGRRAFAEAFRRIRGAKLLDPYVIVACDHRLADANLTVDERVGVAAMRKRLKKASTPRA
ncbi:MAG: phosphotransferase [Ilumatobacter sp.]|uniref:phosphotransferase n=1 Tax=Ilumatobacter sp. TaxID=1967498 RepID=UPI00391AA6F9